jgi:hypothetical protein
VAPLTVLLATQFLSLWHLPEIGAGAPVKVDQAEEQDGSGFLSFSCSNKLKTYEGCVIDLNSKINRIFLSSCMNKSKDL